MKRRQGRRITESLPRRRYPATRPDGERLTTWSLFSRRSQATTTRNPQLKNWRASARFHAHNGRSATRHAHWSETDSAQAGSTVIIAGACAEGKLSVEASTAVEGGSNVRHFLRRVAILNQPKSPPYSNNFGSNNFGRFFAHGFGKGKSP